VLCLWRLQSQTERWAELKQHFTEDLADIGVVHVGEGLQDLSPLVLGPNHEGVHRPLDVRLVAAPTPRLSEYSGVRYAGGA